MGRAPFVAAILVLLLLPAAAPAGARIDSPPEWRVGDRWDYNMTVSNQQGTTYGNLTQEVAAAGTVRVGGRDVLSYTLSSKQTYWGYGLRTTTNSRIYIQKSDLCALIINTTTTTYFGEMNSTASTELRYNASDGRYRFPLVEGDSWTAAYELGRKLRLERSMVEESRNVTAAVTVESPERLSLPAGRFLAYKVTYTYDSGNVTTYWYCDAVRGEAARRELDRSTGTLTVYELKGYHPAPAPLPIIGSDSDKALMLGLISVALVVAALAILAMRRRAPKAPKQKKEQSGPAAPEFHFEHTRDGLQMKSVKPDIMSIACPACHRVFKTPAGAKSVRCPFCGKEGKLG